LLKALVVDDEMLSAERLQKLLLEKEVIDAVDIFTDPYEALENFKKLQPQIVFLDIEMPEINGMELAEKLMEIDSNIKIVFVTAYNQYAIDAFELNALDYLLKPVSRERLEKTISRLIPNLQCTKEQSKVYIKCFGDFGVYSSSREKIIKFRTNKAEELLALLVVFQGKPISSAFIIEALWKNFDVDKAQVNLHTSIYYLRKALKSVEIDDFIKTLRGCYYIDAEKITCDVYDFEEKIKEIDKYKNSTDKLMSILEIYSGSFLDGKDYVWAEEKRNFYELKFLEMLTRLSEMLLKNGEYSRCIDILNIAIKINPLSEELSEMIISTYLLMKDRTNAVKYYNNYKKLLNDDLGIEPGERLTKVYESIVSMGNKNNPDQSY
jgi:two-component SAPR family response regulator